jgi:hypothetical protein
MKGFKVQNTMNKVRGLRLTKHTRTWGTESIKIASKRSDMNVHVASLLIFGF